MNFIHGGYKRGHDSSFKHKEVMDTSFGNRFRVVFFRSKCFIRLNDDPGDVFDENTILFVSSGTYFEYGAAENTAFLHDWLEFSAEPDEVLHYGLDNEFIISKMQDDYARKIKKDIQKIIKEGYGNEKYYKETVELLLKLLLIDLSRYIALSDDMANREKSAHPSYGKVSAMREDILAEAFEDDIVGKVCRKYGMSESNFRKLYKELFYRTISKDILSRRILVAQRYLLNNDCTVSELVYQLGYKNHETFFRQFKRMTGMTPIEYKKRFSK